VSYCFSIHTNEGLVLCASSFSTSNLDQPQMRSYMERFIWPENRFITILSSGNNQTIARVIDKIRKDLKNQSTINLLTAHNLDEITDYIAALSVKAQKELITKYGKSQIYDANFIVAGQIHHQKMETMLIYKEGNYIHEPYTSPFLQIGEAKFGKPILDRIIKRSVNVNTAAHCALVSVDSSIRSNPSKTMKTELLIYKKDSYEIAHYLLLDETSDFFKNMSESWSKGLDQALENLPNFYWEI
jgi:putative proteasome-type protease